VYDIRLAQYIGVPVWDLERIPTWYLDQYRTLREAEAKVDEAKNGKSRR
jgi:hypothetical protein